MLPSIKRTKPVRTVVAPLVAPPLRSNLTIVLTWTAFGLLAAAVITGTTLWSASLRDGTPPAPPAEPMSTAGSLEPTSSPAPDPVADAPLPPEPPVPVVAAAPAAPPSVGTHRETPVAVRPTTRRGPAGIHQTEGESRISPR